jgi:hypothetical protein
MEQWKFIMEREHESGSPSFLWRWARFVDGVQVEDSPHRFGTLWGCIKDGRRAGYDDARMGPLLLDNGGRAMVSQPVLVRAWSGSAASAKETSRSSSGVAEASPAEPMHMSPPPASGSAKQFSKRQDHS